MPKVAHSSMTHRSLGSSITAGHRALIALPYVLAIITLFLGMLLQSYDPLFPTQNLMTLEATPVPQVIVENTQNVTLATYPVTASIVIGCVPNAPMAAFITDLTASAHWFLNTTGTSTVSNYINLTTAFTDLNASLTNQSTDAYYMLNWNTAHTAFEPLLLDPKTTASRLIITVIYNGFAIHSYQFTPTFGLAAIGATISSVITAPIVANTTLGQEELQTAALAGAYEHLMSLARPNQALDFGNMTVTPAGVQSMTITENSATYTIGTDMVVTEA